MGQSKGGTDYWAVDLPDDDDYESWSRDERRALLLQTCLRAGGPSRINLAAFARKFDVNRSTVARGDIDAIRASLAERTDDGRALLLELRSAFEKTYNDLCDAGEPEKAWRVAREFIEMLGGGAPSRVEMDVTTRKASNETDSYVVVDADGDPVDVSPWRVDAADAGELE